jgi:hypothetical protein
MKLVGERRALAAVVFAFYALIYSMIAFSGMVPDFNKAFFALAAVYGLAMFSLVAGYFWARWYAVGVGLYGVITAAVGMWQIGAEPILLFVGGTHLAAALMLWGETMSESYDGQTAWREKLHMDEGAVQRLGRSVIRAGVSLPFVLLYALAPKPGGAELVVGIGALLLAGLGLRALVRLRTWGVFAIGGAGALMVAMSVGEMATHADAFALRPALAGALLISASTPWIAPALRFLRLAR